MIARRPLSEVPAFPVSAGIAAMAIVITVLKELDWNIDALFMRSTAFSTEPWRLVSSSLPHGNWVHLFFNVVWLWVFGTLLEKNLGHIRALAWMVLFSVGSSAAEFAIFDGGIGLSGIGYGLFGMLWALNKRDARFRDAMDDSTARMFVGWFFFCIVLTVTDVWAIANVAHGMGAVLGGLAGLAVAKPHPTRDPTRNWPIGAKPLGYGGLVVALAVSLAAATVGRKYVNFSGNMDMEYSRPAMTAFEAGDFEESARLLLIATEVDPEDPRNWFNLGVAYDRMDRYEEALPCYRRAAQLAPNDPTYTSVARERDEEP